MDSITLRRVQLELLDIAKEIKRVCEILNINYFLDSGTLLGAVRHEGFIPWDDDLDIGMLREDYNLFLEKAPEILEKDYFLQTWHTDIGYGLSFAKLRKRNTVYIEEAVQDSTAQTGFYVDIFPYDTYPVDRRDRRWQNWRYDLYRRCVLLKSGYKPWVCEKNRKKRIMKKLIYCMIGVPTVFFSKSRLIKIYEKAMTRFNSDVSEDVFASSNENYGTCIIKRKCVSEFTMLRFEDDYFRVPTDFDLYLRMMYGDYMTLPPEEERENRHCIIQVKFSDEATMK